MAFMGIAPHTNALNAIVPARLVPVAAALNVCHALFSYISSLYRINALQHVISTNISLQHRLLSACLATQHAQHVQEVCPLSV